MPNSIQSLEDKRKSFLATVTNGKSNAPIAAKLLQDKTFKRYMSGRPVTIEKTTVQLSKANLQKNIASVSNSAWNRKLLFTLLKANKNLKEYLINGTANFGTSSSPMLYTSTDQEYAENFVHVFHAQRFGLLKKIWKANQSKLISYLQTCEANHPLLRPFSSDSFKKHIPDFLEKLNREKTLLEILNDIPDDFIKRSLDFSFSTFSAPNSPTADYFKDDDFYYTNTLQNN